MNGKTYSLELTPGYLVELLVALDERRTRVGAGDASFNAMSDAVAEQLDRQGAMRDLASWYSAVGDALIEEGRRGA